MHPAPAFAQSDAAQIAGLIARRGLALVTAVGESGPLAAHAPVLLDGAVLRFHLSRNNALVGALAARPRALAVVTGPDAYVSPDWYAAVDQVPTWNYLAAEIEGPCTPVGPAETARLLDDLSAHFEARLAPKKPWTRDKMNPARFEAMLGGIVAYDMTIERLSGTWKLSQNKPADEASRVAAALAGLDDVGSQEIAALMR